MKSGVEQFIQNAKNWQDEITLLRSILLECPLTEVIKWGMPCYTFNEKNIVIIQNFKNHCDLGFFNGAALSDLGGLLVKAGKNTQFASQLRFEHLEDIKKMFNLVLKASFETENFDNEFMYKYYSPRIFSEYFGIQDGFQRYYSKKYDYKFKEQIAKHLNNVYQELKEDFNKNDTFESDNLSKGLNNPT
jgi:hypothetical protein